MQSLAVTARSVLGKTAKSNGRDTEHGIWLRATREKNATLPEDSKKETATLSVAASFNYALATFLLSGVGLLFEADVEVRFAVRQGARAAGIIYRHIGKYSFGSAITLADGS